MEYRSDSTTNTFELNQLLEENKKLRDRLISREQQIIRLSNANCDCMRQIKEKNDIIHNLSKERDDAVARRAAIESSDFWCATKPIRRALDKIKGINQEDDIEIKCADKPQNISSIEDLISYFEKSDCDKKQLYGKKLLLNYDNNKQPKILLITHKLDYTGAPIALLHYATMLKEQGYCPLFAVAENDKLIAECEKNEIPVLIDDAINSDIQKYAGLFDAVIANTIVTAPIINQLAETGIPVLWWIHEAEYIYKINEIIKIAPQNLPTNVSVYTAGPYAYEKLLKYRPLYKAKELLYCIPELEKNAKRKESKDKRIKFTVVGLQEYRKGQDILADAIRLLDKNQIENCIFTFVGKKFDEPVYRKIYKLKNDYPENITIINQLDRDEISEWYEQIDCLICPSRDDPMPIVVAEAMQHGKAIICSENTGSAAIVNECECGITYPDNSKEQLAEAIKRIINDGQLVKDFGINAVEAYKKYFTKEVFTLNALQALGETIKALDKDNKKETVSHNEKVSVIIPTYNAGQQFEILMQSLRSQKNIGEVEIVIVDSGSTDKTVETANKYNAKVIKIRNEDFSHSYARNLGAENATGRVLLLMTQDALPYDDNWIFKMTEPIVSGRFAAVTARELCPEDTELFYKISSQADARFRGISEHDRIGFLSSSMDPFELRKNGSLSDVSCAVNAMVFRQFKYRNDYAEDLDLGIRLLRSGYRLLISHDIRVKHGHNRSCSYYIKRMLIEQISFENILPQISSEIDDIHAVALRIVSAANAIYAILKQFKSMILYEMTAEEYINMVVAEFDKYIDSPARFTITDDVVYKDKLLNKCLRICEPYCKMDYCGDYAILHTIRYYLLHDVREYLEIHGMLKMDDESLRDEIEDCIVKQMSMIIGIELSRLRYSIILEEKFGEFLGGV